MLLLVQFFFFSTVSEITDCLKNFIVNVSKTYMYIEFNEKAQSLEKFSLFYFNILMEMASLYSLSGWWRPTFQYAKR